MFRITTLLALLWLTFGIAAAQQVESGYIDVAEEGKIYYEAVGEGIPVVLLHGHTLDLRMWDPQMATLLANHYRVIRPEMRGYGHSSKLSETQHATHLDDILTVLDSLHIDRCHLVGLSMGSFIASEFVALHPERLITATLASGNIRKQPGPSTPIMRADEIKAREKIARNQAMGMDFWRRDWIEQLVGGGGSNAESIRASVTQQVNEWDGWLALNMEPRLYYANEAWDTLRVRRPELPVLILSGDKEKKKIPNPMLEFLPGGYQVVIEDCGHMTNMEKPEEFNRLILEVFGRGEKLEAEKQ